MSERYDGPRCFVIHDEYVPNEDGTYTKTLEAGWHYSTRVDENGNEVVDQKLHLNDSDPDEANWFYEFAEDGHQSWHEKHGLGNPVVLGVEGAE